jgi:hypothetical protein
VGSRAGIELWLRCYGRFLKAMATGQEEVVLDLLQRVIDNQ